MMISLVMPYHQSSGEVVEVAILAGIIPQGELGQRKHQESQNLLAMMQGTFPGYKGRISVGYFPLDQVFIAHVPIESSLAGREKEVEKLLAQYALRSRGIAEA